MKLTKRLLSTLLVLCMVLSMLPTIGLTASAVTTTNGDYSWTAVDFESISPTDTIAVLITKGTARYFLPSSATSTKPTLNTCTYSGTVGNTLTTDVVDGIGWHISGDATNGYTFASSANDSDVLYLASASRDSFRVGSSTTNNTNHQ
ncbi:MAG: hypothetical protein ACI3VU_01765 [Faecousia sp.]